MDIASLVLHEASNDALARDGLAEAGLVRMLWWIPETLKSSIIPSNIPTNRSSFNVGLEMAFSVSEVAGVEPMHSILERGNEDFGQRRRIQTLDNMSSDAVATRMRDNGIEVPEGRWLQAARTPQRNLDRGVANLSPLSNTAKSVNDLRAKLRAVKARLAEVAAWADTFKILRTRHKKLIEASLDTLEYPQCRSSGLSKRKEALQGANEARHIALLDFGLRLINLEASFKSVEASGVEQKTLDKIRSSILAADDAFNKLLRKGGIRTAVIVRELLEDQHALYTSAPLLSRDRRAYEPLQAAPSDFFPHEDVALIDMMPKCTDLSVPELADSRESSKISTQLLKGLFVTGNQPLPLALDRMGVNASKDLIPMVPAITDARKGGRLNPDNLKTRMLTTEMVEGLVKAFLSGRFGLNRGSSL
ncbi:hypothetical protein LTR37_017141 [Vermiconidia calcicola]|uniref:Uncharacterized protein n=1 Tax=Vermiconidia calcicola TaxID=1690605 RepID=A0ACC3MLI2_9PEZI|nr:hypothetical protein LTR37_017141 [Vermiconidia calcicola]